MNDCAYHCPMLTTQFDPKGFSAVGYPMLLALLLFLLLGCRSDGSKTDFQNLPTYDGTFVNVVVEIPAGTNHKIEYDKTAKLFKNDTLEGKNRIIRFLPYPGNYGFIPSTFMDPARGGDGDALDILVIGESVPTGSVIKTIPVGVLLLRDRGELDSKIIAVPAETDLRVIDVTNFSNFQIEFDGAKRLIESWFLNYKGAGRMEMIAWRDDAYARREIEKWAVLPAD